MRIVLAVILVASAAIAIYVSLDLASIGAWAVEQQRAFQNQMAGAVRALRTGDPGAYAALLAGAGAYGFVHALGPGHGKYLIGGVGLGTSVSATRLLSLALASSVAQALWAILLVYGGFTLFELSASRMTALAEDVFAPVSYLAIGTIGVVLIWRGVRALPRRAKQGQSIAQGNPAGYAMAHSHVEGQYHPHGFDHGSDGDECGCAAHGPTPQQVARLGSFREALMLIGSIAIRPCTGAIFLLIIAWQMDIQLAGAIAVIVMGLGTAGLTSLVAVSSVAARGVTFASAGGLGAVAVAFPALQIFAGALIMWISLILLRFAI